MRTIKFLTRATLVGIIFIISQHGVWSQSAPIVIKSNSGQLKLQTATDPTNYYTIINSNYNYGSAFSLVVKGGSTEKTILSWGEETGMNFYGGYVPRYTFNGSVIVTGDISIPKLDLSKYATYNTASIAPITLGNSNATSVNGNAYYSYSIKTPGDANGLRLGIFQLGNGVVENEVLSIAKGNVGIGTTSPVDLLSVNGNFRAKQVKVMTDIALGDYVFKNTYKLRPLSEVEAYIKANNHLPEVPSAAEVKENGIDVAAMENTLLVKIEELTLYMIELKKEVELLKKENQTLKTTK